MPDPESEPLLASGRMSRKDSEPDMMLRLSHDAQVGAACCSALQQTRTDAV